MVKAFLLLFVCTTASAEDLLSIPGLANTVAVYAKQSKVVGLVDINGKLGTGGFLPVRTLRDSAGINYVQAGIGADIKQGENTKPLVIVSFDISAFVRRAENFQWYHDHVSKVILPDVWIGPYLDAVGFTTWKNWKQCLGATVSVGL